MPQVAKVDGVPIQSVTQTNPSRSPRPRTRSLGANVTCCSPDALRSRNPRSNRRPSSPRPAQRLRSTCCDAELKPSARDQIGGARVLYHVERVLVTHIYDGCPDLDAAGLRTDGREQGKRRGELAREVMDPEIGSVRAQLLGGNGQVDGLQECVCGRARL